MDHADRLDLAHADLRSGHSTVLAEEAMYATNPELYEAFEDATMDLIEAGWPQFSHWLVANYVRYTTMTEHGREFKVPNGVIAIWARRFIVAYPEHDVFRIKGLKDEAI